MNDVFKIYSAKKKDLMDIFYLSNDPIVRQNSFNQKDIPLNDHILWFENKLKDKSCFFYVVRSGPKEFVGYIRFDKNRDEDILQKYTVTIHMHSKFRGKGLGSDIIKKTSLLVLEKKSEALLVAYIKKNNIGSLKSFVKSNYFVVGEEIVKGCECFKLEFCKNENFSCCGTSR